MWSNAESLELLPWWAPNERFEAGVLATKIGSVKLTGEIALESEHTELLQSIWSLMLVDLPLLPWPEIQIYTVASEWPLAISVPGAILVSGRLDVDSARSVVLYLVHELFHQWIGGLLAPPKLHSEHQAMEAFVDACTWWIAESSNPGMAGVFEALYQRYDGVESLRDHARLVRSVHEWLRGANGWAQLVGELHLAAVRLRAGDRYRFDPASLKK